MMIIALLTAAGTGSRIEQDIPNWFSVKLFPTRVFPSIQLENCPRTNFVIRGRAHGVLAEIFFLVYGKTSGFAYHTNNSKATECVRNLLGIP